MLEKLFVRPDAAQRHRSCVLGPHLDAFVARLAELGYPRSTLKGKLWIVVSLARWMARGRLTAAHLDEARADEFLAAWRHRHSRRRRGHRRTLLQLLEVLRSAGVVRPPEPAQEDASPAGALLRRYAAYLRGERSLAPTTIAGYHSFVRLFVEEHLRGDATRTGALRPGDVREFLLARVGRMAPRRAQYMVTALRSFLRFLFLRGETASNLASAIPTVRQWRWSTVPRHLAAKDVARLLRVCGGSTSTRRRDHAILLLLARLGLRAGEVVALELSDLRWRQAEIVVPGKGLVRDRLPLPTDVGKAVALYLRKDRPPSSSRRVFLRERAPHLGLGHAATVSTIVARALARAGLAPPTRGAHLLRHSLATGMLRRGASLVEIGQVLRHRSPNSTEIYAKLDFGSLRDVALPWPASGGAR